MYMKKNFLVVEESKYVINTCIIFTK